MPQLDFREALSTPEEKSFSPSPTLTAASAVPLDKKTSDFDRGVRFSRSTWTNIFFVAIASVGGLVCAFYFFNGGELLRAAAAWPNEFLYPRPVSTDKIDIGQQVNPVDRFVNNEAGSITTAQAKAPSGKNVGPSDFSQPATTLAASNPAVTTPGGSGPTLLPTGPSLPAPFSLPPAPSVPSGLGLPANPDINSLFQPLEQKAPAGASKKAIARTTNRTRTSSRRKASSTQQKLTSQTKSATTTQSMQQASNQTQVPMNSIQTPTAMGMSGGLGGGLGGAVGGVGGSLGGGLGGLGGTVGGIVGGHH